MKKTRNFLEAILLVLLAWGLTSHAGVVRKAGSGAKLVAKASMASIRVVSQPVRHPKKDAKLIAHAVAKVVY